MTPRRYPLEALVAASGLSEAALARAVGLSGTTLKLARENGLREDAADRYACRAGLVPWLVWSDWLEDVAVPCPECQAPFVPSRQGHVFCSRRCRDRRWKRERYRQDSQHRAAILARVKEHDDATRRAKRLKQAAYRAQNRDRLLARRRELYRQGAA